MPMQIPASMIAEEEKLTISTEISDPYYHLLRVLRLAFIQASAGKGAERHAQGQSFEEQPMQTISRLINSPDGMYFQAMKKMQEAKRLPTHEAKVRELLGAINYIAGIVIYLDASEAAAKVKANAAADSAAEAGFIKASDFRNSRHC